MLVASAGGARDASAQRGATLTPDRLTYIVNKDVGADRWTITVNLATFDPLRVINVTGNVYRPGVVSPSFIWCQVRPDSTGTLADPASVFRLRCHGTESCIASALGCARESWVPIADDVALPASFFLPVAGNGASARTAAQVTRPASDLPAATVATRPLDPSAAPRGIAGRGTSLPPDVSNFLVNKDVGADRWSISLNLIPAQTLDPVAVVEQIRESRLTNRPLNVTGNVFPAGGGAPIFIFCQERADSFGDLTNLQSLFRLTCLGMGPCERTATDCALGDWQPIPGADDVQVQASFFLPMLGLPGTPQSDPEIIVIGRTSDGTSVVTSTASPESRLDVVAGGACPAVTCSLRVGSCESLSGTLELQPSGACACRVSNVPDQCLGCGAGASGQCGGSCSFPVGSDATARGTCLPFSAGSTECGCVAATFEAPVVAGQCGGALGAVCPSGECCTDDPRDGCDPANGDASCAGICVDAGSCDPDREICGSCFDQRNASGGSCFGKDVPPGGSCCDDALCRQSGDCVCNPGTVCVEDEPVCCPTNTPQFCARVGEEGELPCVLAGAECCAVGRSPFCLTPARCPATAGNLCIGPDGVECASGAVCSGGFVCFSGTGCLSRSAVDCGNGTACPSGAACRSGGCVAAGDEECGNGRVCRVDDGVYCAPDGSTCVPFGGEYCGNGLACGVNELCSADRRSCEPLIDCGTGFCQPGFQCSTDGVSCIAPGRVDCGGGASCPVGTFCGSARSCIELGRVDCGGAFSCPAGTECTADRSCRFLDAGDEASQIGRAASSSGGRVVAQMPAQPALEAQPLTRAVR